MGPVTHNVANALERYHERLAVLREAAAEEDIEWSEDSQRDFEAFVIGNSGWLKGSILPMDNGNLRAVVVAYACCAGKPIVIERLDFRQKEASLELAAALVLAHRLLGCSERIPRRWVCPVGNGVQVAFTVPVRKRVKYVWTYWGTITGQLRLALAARHRLGKRRRRPNPVQAVVRASARGVA